MIFFYTALVILLHLQEGRKLNKLHIFQRGRSVDLLYALGRWVFSKNSCLILYLPPASAVLLIAIYLKFFSGKRWITHSTRTLADRNRWSQNWNSVSIKRNPSKILSFSETLYYILNTKKLYFNSWSHDCFSYTYNICFKCDFFFYRFKWTRVKLTVSVIRHSSNHFSSGIMFNKKIGFRFFQNNSYFFSQLKRRSGLSGRSTPLLPK